MSAPVVNGLLGHRNHGKASSTCCTDRGVSPRLRLQRSLRSHGLPSQERLARLNMSNLKGKRVTHAGLEPLVRLTGLRRMPQRVNRYVLHRALTDHWQAARQAATVTATATPRQTDPHPSVPDGPS